MRKLKVFILMIVMVVSLLPMNVFAVTGSAVAKDGTYSTSITAYKSGKASKNATINVIVTDGLITDLTFSGSDAKDFKKYLMGEKGTEGMLYLDKTASADAVDAVSSATQGRGKYTIDLKSAIKNALLNAEERENSGSGQTCSDGPLDDGEYIKDFTAGDGRYSATVKITVSGGKISDITVDNKGSGDWTTPLADAKNNLVGKSSASGVDAISSATQYSQALEDAIIEALCGEQEKDDPVVETYSAPVTAVKTKDGKTKTATVNVTLSNGKISRISFSGGDADDFEKYLKTAKTGSDKYNMSWYEALVGKEVDEDLIVDATSSASLKNETTTSKYGTNLQQALLEALEPLLSAVQGETYRYDGTQTVTEVPDNAAKIVVPAGADVTFSNLTFKEGVELDFSPDAIITYNGVRFESVAPGNYKNPYGMDNYPSIILDATEGQELSGDILSKSQLPATMGTGSAASLSSFTFRPSGSSAAAPGLSAALSGDTVTISGTPTAPGTYPVGIIDVVYTADLDGVLSTLVMPLPVSITVKEAPDTPDPVSADVVVVKKIWSDDAAIHKNDTVVAGIYNESGAKVKEVTLNAGNSWEQTITDLDASASYTVQEESVNDKEGKDISEDYDTEITVDENTVTTKGGWQSVGLGAVSAGKTYAFTYESGGTTYLLGRSGTSVVGSIAGLDGSTPASSIGEDYQWTVENATSGTRYGSYALKNNGNGNYLALYNGSSTGYQNSAIVNSNYFSYYSGMNLNFDDDGSIWAGYTSLNMLASGATVASNGSNWTVFTPYEYTNVSTTTKTATFTITNTLDESVEHHKSIEKTEDNEYNIKLTVEGGEKKVVDQSAGGGSGASTTEAVDVVLLLDYSATMNATRLSNMKQQATSFINTLAGNNGDSKVAVIAYGQYSIYNYHININTLNGGWTTLSTDASALTSALNAQGNLTGDNYSYGTDHGGAYEQAQKLLDDSGISSDGRNKYIVNISDGVFDYAYSPYYSTTEADTMKAAGATIYYITVGTSADSAKVNSLATSASHVYSGGNSGEAIASAFASIGQDIKDGNEVEPTYTTVPMTATIKDTLSNNVEKNGAVAVTDSDGNMLVEGEDYTLTENGKAISVVIKEAAKGTTYTVSIPVKVTDATKADFKDNKEADEANYPDTSDAGEKGYFSNNNNTNENDTKVTLTYKYGEDGDEVTLPYEEKPVVQVVADPDPVKYKITFVDEDGTTVLKSATEYDEGTKAADIVKPADPTKDETDEYTYEFAGWTPEISDVTGDVTYKATYTATKKTYTVTYNDGQGKTIKTETVDYGSDTPSCDNPTRDGYTFKGWTPDVADKVKGNATYTANWEKNTRNETEHGSITVNKVDENDSDLRGATFVLKDGDTEIATYAANPSFTIKTDDAALADYLPESGEEKELTLVEKAAPEGYVLGTDTYIVKITASEKEELKNGTYVTTTTYTIKIEGADSKKIKNTKKTYTIKFVDEDGTEIKSLTVKHGDVPSAPADPEKDEDDSNTYTFDKWSPEIVAATEDATYTASYTATPKPVTPDPEPGEIKVDKKATPADGEDNTWDLTMEAYATAEKVSVSADGADIVLALDLSSSMNSNRMAALKSAVDAFADSLPDGTTIGIVTFADNVQTASSGGSQKLTKDQVKTVAASLSADSSSTGTNMAAGIRAAQAWITANGSYDSKNIIVFSDGYPEKTGSEADDSYAWKNAIDAATQAKETGTDVYTVNINSNADAFAEPAPVGQRFGDALGMGSMFGVNEDIVNTLMHYISSNYTGVAAQAHVDDNNYGKVTAATKTGTGYYLAGSDVTSLFTDLAKEVADYEPANADLSVDSALVDYINTDKFDVTDPLQAIVIVYDYVDGEWSEAATQPDLTVTGPDADGKITVTGFDYSKHWLADDGTEAPDGAQKIVLTVKSVIGKQTTAEQKDVPTNTEKSGVYADPDSDEPTEAFPVPKVDIPAKEPDPVKYTVTFVDEDGTTVLKEATEYDEGTKAADIAKPADPKKADTDEYTYEFAGWTPEISDVTGDVTYKATYTETPIKKYKVTFYDWDGKEISSAEYKDGTPASEISVPADPSRTADAEYSYSFTGWDKTIADINGADATYTAKYSQTKNKYTVKWLDEDGSVLDEETYEYGETPSYKKEIPTKDATDEFTYAFEGWEPIVVEVTKDATYKAKYGKETNQYTITYTDGQGNTLKSEAADYGAATPSCDDPVREGYDFTGWSPDVSETVTKNATYTATWKKKTYTVTFDADGGDETPDAQSVEHGDKASSPATPTKAGYDFKGWKLDDADYDFNSSVTSDIVLKAVWEEKATEPVTEPTTEEPTEPSTEPTTEEPTEPSTEPVTEEPTEPSTEPTTEEPTESSTEKPAEPSTEPTTEKLADELLYTIIFDPNGGMINGSSNPVTTKYKVGTEISIMDAPEREGYTFLYWEGSNYHPGDKYLVTEDHTFVAKWKKNDESGSQENPIPANTPSSNDSGDSNVKGDDGKTTEGAVTKITTVTRKSVSKASGSTQKSGSSKAPKTGDETSNIPLVLLIISLAAIVTLFVARAKRSYR